MTSLLIDTSVLIKWFHAEGENELEVSRRLRTAHLRGDVDAHVLDLALYEVGNVLTRALGWSAAATGDQLDDLLVVVGPPLAPSMAGLRRAAELAVSHQLTFYDACWAATAIELSSSLVSCDAQLIRAGLAESPTQVCERLRLQSRVSG